MIFNINFFLFSFALSNVWSYTCVYAKYYASVTNIQYGMFAMALPMLCLFAKPIACSLTDAHGIHKQFLMGLLVVCALSNGALGVLPFFKDPEDHSTDTIAWITMATFMAISSVSCACIFCMNDALSSNYARKHNLSYAKMRIWSNLGWACGPILMIVIGEVTWIPFRVLGCSILVVAITLQLLALQFWPYPEDFEMFHDGSTVEQRKLSMVGPNTLAFMAQKKPRGSISKDVLERIRAGRSKSVGGLPRIENSISVNQDVVKKQEDPQKEYSNFQCQMILMKMIAGEHKSFIRYIVLFTIFGIVQAMVWNFQIVYFEQRVVKDQEELNFISNLCMIAQSFCGEILINFVANDMLRLFGANANFSLALVTLGLRCYFYANLLPYMSPLAVIIAESLQGPSLGLYWVLAVDVGSNYALMVPDFMPELRRRGIVRDRRHEEELSGCLRATMIGVMSSSMEGLGVGIGALLGGMISTSFGYEFMWNLCAVVAISVGFINLGWDLVRKLVLKGNKEKENKRLNNNIPTLVIEETFLKVPPPTRL